MSIKLELMLSPAGALGEGIESRTGETHVSAGVTVHTPQLFEPSPRPSPRGRAGNKEGGLNGYLPGATSGPVGRMHREVAGPIRVTVNGNPQWEVGSALS